MTLAHRLALLWGLLAVPIVILYLRRMRLRREPVATSMIWERVLAAEGARSAWQRWRKPVSLAVQLILLFLWVLALAEPQIPPPQQLVLIIDTSDSMNATDIKPSRLARARESARQLIAARHDYDRLAVVSAGSPAGVRCALMSDRAMLERALADVPAGRGTTDMITAVELARRLLGDAPRGRIVILSDGCFEGAAKLAGFRDVEFVRIGSRAGNVAVTRLVPRRRLGYSRVCQVLVEVTSFSDEPVECRLEVQLEGETVQTAPIKLAANGRWQRVFEMTATWEGGRLVARLDCPDGLLCDNGASALVPADPKLWARTPSAVQIGPLVPDDLDRSAAPASQGDQYVERVLAGAVAVEDAAELREKDFRAPAGLGVEPAALTAGPHGLAVWPFLVFLGVALLATEWCFYQRRWTN